MKTMLMAVLGTMATAALAQEATPDTWMSQAGTTETRAAVRAEAARARAAGELAVHATGYLPTVARSRLRTEVVAELLQARQSGEFAALSAEAHDFAAVPRATAYAAGR